MTKNDLILLLEQARDSAAVARAFAEFIGDAEINAKIEKIFTKRKRGRPSGEAVSMEHARAVIHFRRYRDLKKTAAAFPSIQPTRLQEICRKPNGRILERMHRIEFANNSEDFMAKHLPEESD